MVHTALTINNEGISVTRFENKRELAKFLQESKIRRHRSEAMAGKCGVEDLGGNTIFVFKGEPMAIQFQESFKF